MHYAEGGAGNTPVVLIHGVTLNWESMTEIGTSLGDIAHLYACDLPGHGRSDWAAGEYVISVYVDEVSGFIREVSGRGSVVIGFSLGALVAIGVAARVPDLVRGVAALEPPLISRNTGFDAFKYSDAHAWIQWVNDLNGGRLAPSEAVARFLRMNPESSETDAHEAMAYVASVDPRVTARIVSGRTFEGFDIQETLARLACPALLLAGEVRLGGLVRDEDMKFFTAHTAQGQASRIQDGGHSIIWDAPAATVAGNLMRWLNTL
jgi:pimeloyl-ACP methyl ester carboxylesterase